MAPADRLTQASLVLAHLPADQAVEVLQRLAPSQRRAVRRKLESFTPQELSQSSEAVSEFVAAYHRIDAADAQPGRPHHAPVADLPAPALPQTISPEPGRLTVRPNNPPSPRGRAAGFEFLENLSDDQFLSVMRDELPVTIATVLSQLSPEAHNRFCAAMPEPLRRQVVSLLGKDRTPLSILELLSTILRKRTTGFGFPTATDPRSRSSTVPHQSAIEGRQTPAEIPARLPAAGPQSAGTARGESTEHRIRRQDPGVEGFNAIAHLPAAAVRHFLNQAPWDELSVAFIGAQEAVKQRLLEQMLPAERALLRENMRLLGPVRQDRTDRQRARLARLLAGNTPPSR
ncbi:MAG: FliG C-terminal domain-containing protein [Pirellulales bacterium]